MLSSILKNKIVVYLASRYGTYALQFFISLIIAAKLGPYYMGLYGVVLLIIGYFAQFHFGIANSLNILLVHNKENREKYNNYVANSLILVAVLGGIIVLLFLYYWIFGIGYIKELMVENYLPYICAIAVLEHFDGVFTNVLRVKNYVTQITIIQSLNVLCNTAVVCFFGGKDLVLALVISLLVSNVLKAIIAVYCKILPKIKDFQISNQTQKEILSKGFCLFIYNSCLMFVLIAVRTLISGNYTLEQFGYFTFSFTIANAVMLLLDSLAFIIFPKLIDVLSSKDMKKVNNSMSLIKDLYISTAHMFIYIAMLLFPVLLWFMPQYKDALTSMNLIALTVLMSTNTFGYSTFLLAQNKEKIAAILAFSTMVISVCAGLLFVKVLHVEFDQVILSTLITYLIYSIACMAVGEGIIGENGFLASLKSAFPIRLFIPFSVALVLAILKMETMLFIPIVLYVVLNVRTIKTIYSYVRQLLNNPNITDIN